MKEKQNIQNENVQGFYVRLMKYLSEEMRYRYASHPDTQVDVLEYLAQDPSSRVRQAVKDNLSLSKEFRDGIRVE